jgi:hypothetical protein
MGVAANFNVIYALPRSGDTFDPADVVTSWLLNTTASATVTTVSDPLNPASPATTVAGRQPAADANGAMTFDTDALLIPAIAARKGTTRLGWGFWVELDNLTVQHYLLRYGPGTANDPVAGDSLMFRVNAVEQLSATIYTDGTGTATRVATSPVDVVGSGQTFVTLELDLEAATEADQLIITANLVELALTFSGTAGAMPPSLQDVSADIIFGNRRSNLSTLPFIGRTAEGIYVTNVKSPNASRGVWSADERAALAGLNPLAA